MKITQEYLAEINACQEARKYADKHLNGGKPLAEVVRKLHRGDWLIWLLVKTNMINRRQAVKLACVAARRALRFVPKGEDRPLKAILAAEAWSKEPSAASAAARTAARTAASDAASAAAWAAARTAASDAACAAARDAARTAAMASEHKAIAQAIRAEMKKAGFKVLAQEKKS